MTEQEALGKKLQNIEKMRELELSTADSCVEKLANASSNLEVQPSEATVIDITNILKAAQKNQEISIIK